MKLRILGTFILAAVILSCTGKNEQMIKQLNESHKKEDRKIVYDSGHRLYEFSFIGEDKEIYFDKEERYIGGPSLSKDRRNVVFSVQNKGEDKMDEVFLMNTDGSGLRKLISFESASAPSLSPDKQKVAFWGNYNTDKQSMDLFIYDIDNHSIRLLNKEATYCGPPYAPSWSPDSRQLVYASLDGYVTVINIGNLSSNKIIKGDAPSWSPDGKTIIFRDGISYFRVLPDKITTEYYIKGHKYYSVDTKGENKRFVFNGKSSFWDFVGSAYKPVVWSPDSKKVLFIKPGEGRSIVYVVEMESGKLSLIKELRGGVGNFSWQ